VTNSGRPAAALNVAVPRATNGGAGPRRQAVRAAFARAVALLLLVMPLLAMQPVAASPTAANCEFQFGFAVLHDQLPQVVGDCTADETHNPANGDALQQTTNGLLAWRKADNWTAFTNGTTTWINGPCGLAARPNQSLFPWEQGGGCGPASDTATLLAAGDITDCEEDGDSQTAAILARETGAIAVLGDDVYPHGTLQEFQQCFDPTWGQFKTRIHPVPGNKEYETPGAAGYFAYFGAAAGPPGKGWYSFDLAGWHIVALNSNCQFVGGCQAGSEQEQWLRADLAAHPAACTLAYWHHTGFWAGGGDEAGDAAQDVRLHPLWQALYDAGAEVILAGHNHMYERYAPQNAHREADPQQGIRLFTVGTGGESHNDGGSDVNIEVRNAATFGILKLTLYPDGYDWQFLPVAGATFTDSGSGACH
jgi:hypothetical protein